VWVEIVTLLDPGFNDSEAELRGLTAFIASVSPDIPWHVTAFHQDYKMTDPENTTPEMLLRAVAIARDAGLRYVYAGNAPGRVGDLEHTSCHACGERLISRYGYLIQEYHVTETGTCPRCATAIPGRWGTRFEGQRTAFPFLPHDRTRLTVF
jgi:pyruvate formate lyase activating enzyme